MTVAELRYVLTEHKQSMSIFSYRNFKMLFHPEIINYIDLLNRVEDDINLIPGIESTSDNTEIKFYTYNYNEQVYYKNEILSFIFASINPAWNIEKGIDISTGEIHFWLKYNDIIFDPSLAVITKEEIYKKYFKQLTEIENENIASHLSEHNNLYKFYQTKQNEKNNAEDRSNFSIDFINKIKKSFNENINKQYILDEEKIEKLRKSFSHNNYIDFRQVLTQKRTSYLQTDKIAVHPSIEESILEDIEEAAKSISNLMETEYNLQVDYHKNTLRNCYALSIIFNLYNGEFKLAQGVIPYEEELVSRTVTRLYQHSWLEMGNIIYDPAFRIITTKDLYYTFFQKEDEYSNEDTENILRRVGFNLTYFKAFMNGEQIGNNEVRSYRNLVKDIDSPKSKEEGERLIYLVKSLKKQQK